MFYSQSCRLIHSILLSVIGAATVRASFMGHLSKAGERLVGSRITAQKFGMNLEQARFHRRGTA